MKKNLLMTLISGLFLMAIFTQVSAQGPTQIFFAGFDKTPITPLEITVMDDLGYSVSDDYVQDSIIVLEEITIPSDAGDQVAEGIRVQYSPANFAQQKFYGLTFTASAAEERTANLFIGNSIDSEISYLDTTFTITTTSETYSFQFEMTAETDTAALVAIGFGLSDVAVDLDDVSLNEVVKMTNECIQVEAESFADQPNFGPYFSVVDTANKYTETACGGAYINTDSTNTSSSSIDTSNIDYEFTVNGGIYQVWFRGLGLGGGDDSFWIRMDTGSWFPFNNALRDTAWIWDKVHDSNNGSRPVSFHLEAGTHTFSIAHRESGAMIDKIMITTDTLGVPEGCDGCSGLGGDYSFNVFTSDASVNTIEPVELDVMDGYAIDSTYEYVRDGQLSIEGITLPGTPENDGIQINYGPFATQAFRQYNVSFYATADESRQASIYVGTKTDPDSVFIEIPFIMLNTTQKYEFNFEVDDSNITENAMLSIQLGASDVPVQIDSILITEDFLDVTEECFTFEPEDFSDQELFGPHFEVVADTGMFVGACGGFAVNSVGSGTQSEPQDTGRITIEFDVQERAIFVAWFRVIAPSGTDDSFWVIMDGENINFNGIETSTAWTWDLVKGDNDPHLFDLLPGTHKLEIQVRENGTMLDKVFITNQLAVTPDGCEVCTGSTGVDEDLLNPLSGNKTQIYPNPASGSINIKLNEDVPGELRVYDILGKVVKTERIENSTSISIDELSTGVYFFEFNSAAERSIQKILVK